ncbi:MAG: DoxX family protein [Balneolaceae bacterium]
MTAFFSDISNHIYLIGAMFIFAGILHFIFPKKYLKIMPDYIPNHMAMVFWSGIFEILGGIGIMFSFSKTFSAVGLCLLLVAVFPANIDMFRKTYSRNGFTLFTLITLLRLPLQFWLIYWVLASAQLLP